MKKYYKFLIIIIIIIIIIMFRTKSFYNIFNNKLDNNFYDKNIYPRLTDINKLDILTEIYGNLYDNNDWLDWPESSLYENNEVNGDWKIIPFYAFNIWCKKNCLHFPKLTEYLKTIPGMRIALISKLNPKTKLISHYGWGMHSNNVLRCHYGIILPKNQNESYVGVINNNIDEKQFHKLNDWIIFDDSKLHYAENKSDEERIVLIIDIDRPYYIKKGISTITETSELIEIVNKIKILNDE